MDGRLLDFCNEKELCCKHMFPENKEKSDVEGWWRWQWPEIDFVSVSKENRKYLRVVKVILWELQHRLVVADLNKRKLKKIVGKERIVRSKE